MRKVCVARRARGAPESREVEGLFVFGRRSRGVDRERVAEAAQVGEQALDLGGVEDDGDKAQAPLASRQQSTSMPKEHSFAPFAAGAHVAQDPAAGQMQPPCAARRLHPGLSTEPKETTDGAVR